MNESIMTLDEQSSTKSLVCQKSDLPELTTKHPIETIIYVSDEMFRPYILLKDINDEPYWRPYGGESIEDVRRFHEWELEAQRKFSDNRRSPEELDYLRNLIMAISLVSNFFNLGSFMDELTMVLVSKLATKWYCTDKNIEETQENCENIDEKEIAPYIQLVVFYVQSLVSTINETRKNVEASSLDKH